jgi:hypothetical protein
MLRGACPERKREMLRFAQHDRKDFVILNEVKDLSDDCPATPIHVSLDSERLLKYS